MWLLENFKFPVLLAFYFYGQGWYGDISRVPGFLDSFLALGVPDPKLWREYAQISDPSPPFRSFHFQKSSTKYKSLHLGSNKETHLLALITYGKIKH